MSNERIPNPNPYPDAVFGQPCRAGLAGRPRRGRHAVGARGQARCAPCQRLPGAGVPVDVRGPPRDGRRRVLRPEQPQPARFRARERIHPASSRSSRSSWRSSGRSTASVRRSPSDCSSSMPRHSASPIGYLVSLYTTGSVVTAFLSASAMFGAAAIYGRVTQRNLAALGGILFMGLIGLLVAMVLNIFLQSSAITWLISIVGVVPVHGPDRVRRPAHPVGRPRGAPRLDGEGGRRRRPHSSTSTSSTCSSSCSACSAATARLASSSTDVDHGVRLRLEVGARADAGQHADDEARPRPRDPSAGRPVSRRRPRSARARRRGPRTPAGPCPARA